jgi:hypothetical protein
MSAADMQNVAAIEDPKSTLGVFELPCGYLDSEGNVHNEVALRELTGAEEDLLASKQLTAFKKYNELITRCTLRVGNVTDVTRIPAIVKALPVGDRLFMLFALRRVSLGDNYTFDATCPDKACGATCSYTIDLSTLENKKMPDPRKRVFDAVLPTGATARFRVSTGADEERSMQSDKSEDTLSKGILMRLELLNGAPPSLADVKAMKWRDRVALREQWNTVEGGVDTEVDMTCATCGHEYKRDVEVSAGFFFPSATSKT